MSSLEKWEHKQPCPACGENIVSSLLDMHLDLECEGTDEDDKEEDLVHTIRSHLSKDVIIWSSDPKSLPPTLGYQPKDVPGSLFFVKTPKKSEASKGWEAELAKAAELIDNATAILIVAGAGIGVDSGLPDYRGPTGFWRAYPALEKLGLTIEDISHRDWFSKDPLFAWGFYGHRIDLYKQAEPHEGFQALKDMVDAKNSNYFIFTSNIDGQFQKAGFEDERIYECHGSLNHLQCLGGCGYNEVWQLDPNGVLPQVDMKSMKAKKSTIPKCPNCNAGARPNVSMFGDTSASWNPTRSEQQRHRLLNWLREAFPYSNEGKFDVISNEPVLSTNSLSFPNASPVNNTTITSSKTTTKTTRKTRKTNNNNSQDVNTTTSVEYEQNVDIVQQTQQKRENSTEPDTIITQTTKRKKINTETTKVTRSKRMPESEDKEKETSTNQTNPTNQINQPKPKFEPIVTRKRGKLMELERAGKRLVIIECGCGVSLHSIRIESEALLRNSNESDKGERVRLVRLNPTDWQVPQGGNVGLGLGAKAGLQGIAQRLECTKTK